MPRGKGRRQGTEAPQATDVSKTGPIAPGGEDRAALEAVIDSAPQAASRTETPVAAPPVSMTPEGAPNLTDPSTRPAEPIQSGLSTGPGIGPIGDPGDTLVEQLAMLYRKFPNPVLRERLEVAQRRFGR